MADDRDDGLDNDTDDDIDDEELSVDEITRILRDFATGERSFDLLGRMGNTPAGERCPSCGKDQVFRIMYGFPMGVPPNDVILGGCIVSWGAPKKGCKACGWRPSFLETLEVGESERRSPFRFPATADNEMPQDEDPSDFDEAYADIERWIAKYSDDEDGS